MTTADLFSSGHLTEEGIGLYVDGLKLGRMSELPAEILEHVAECGKCRIEIVELHQVLEEVSYAEGSAHPYFDRVPARSPEQSRIPYAVAAILVLAIGVTYIVSTFSTREEQGGQVETSGKTVMTRPDTTHTRKPALVKEQPAKKHPRDKVLASNFEPSPNLEDLVGSEVRSSSIEVMSPSAGETVSGTVRFLWKAGAGGPVRLRVLSNTEKVVESAEVSGSGHILEGTLSPGLYYWTLEADSELLYVGKFIVQ